MWHKLHHAIAIVSLMLFVGNIALWISSYWRVHYVIFNRTDRSIDLAVDHGLIILSIYTDTWKVAGDPLGWNVGMSNHFQYARTIYSHTGNHVLWALGLEPPRVDPSGLWEAGAPLWLASLITAILPAAGLRHRWRRYRWRRQNRCTACGYDVRASPEQCPECGEFIVVDMKESRPSHVSY